MVLGGVNVCLGGVTRRDGDAAVVGRLVTGAADGLGLLLSGGAVGLAVAGEAGLSVFTGEGLRALAAAALFAAVGEVALPAADEALLLA